MKQTFVLLLVFNFLLNYIHAQTTKDPIYISYSLIPNAKLDSFSGDLSQSIIEANAMTPKIKLTKNIDIYNVVYFKNSRLDAPNSLLHNSRLNSGVYDLRYSIIGQANLTKYWDILTIARLNLRSNFKHTEFSNDIFPYFVILAQYKMNTNPNFKIGLGLALNNDFSHNAIIPTGSLFYRNSKFNIEIAYPTAQFLYLYNSKFEFGLFSQLDASISNISFDNQNSSAPHYFRNLQLYLAPTASYNFYKSFYLHAKIGLVTLRKQEFLDQNFQSIANETFKPESSLFMRVGISMRIKE